MIAATSPGATWGSALAKGLDVYASAGHPDEWQHHYQGGPIGYGAREFSVAPPSAPNAFTDEVVLPGQPFAWNPTVAGAKSEDTFIAAEGGAQALTNGDGWPTLSFDTPARAITRPAIAEL